MIVRLTSAEKALAWFVAGQRRITDAERNYAHRYGSESRRDLVEVTEVVAAMGEMAVAKWTGGYWKGCDGDVKSPDVFPNIQVRSSRRTDACLIVHPPAEGTRPGDNPTHRFVLVRVTPSYDCDLVGWMLGADAQTETYWRIDRPSPAYFVPPLMLRPWISWEAC